MRRVRYQLFGCPTREARCPIGTPSPRDICGVPLFAGTRETLLDEDDGGNPESPWGMTPIGTAARIGQSGRMTLEKSMPSPLGARSTSWQDEAIAPISRCRSSQRAAK